LNDYRAILCILLGKAVLSLAASHFLAQRPYRLSWDAVLARENFRFGWPLLVTSFVMVGIFQGDRFLIASRYSFADLGSYAAAATMAMAPGMMLFKITGPIALPLLAKVQEFPKKFMLHYGVFTQGMALCASVFAVAMVLGSEPAVTLLFGQKYRTAATLVTWLALAQAVRILRGAPTCAAMAKGDTVNTLMSNVWRLSGLVLAVPFAISKMDLRWIAIAGGVGEVIAYWYAIRDLQAKCEVPLLSSLLPAGGLMISTLAAFAVKWAFCPSQTLWIVAFSILGCVGSVLLFALVFSDLRKAVCSLAVDVASEAKLLVQRKFLRSVPTGS
jgi:O-antigen/teichoic acid export membrane protein